MRISRSTGYALLAVGYIAKHAGKNEVVLSQEIAKEFDIPLEYLLKILQQLVRANILRSKRGPRGGFALAKAPNKISMLQVIEAVDGPLQNHFDLLTQDRRTKLAAQVEKVFDNAVNQARSVFAKTKLSVLLR